MVLATDGNLYGVLAAGGQYGRGTVFRVTPDGTVSTAYPFGLQYFPLDLDGRVPFEVIQHPNGDLYGVTSIGGESDQGTVFRLSLIGVYQKLYDFGGFEGDGDVLDTTLTVAANGDLYGTTLWGGVHAPARRGTVFRISPSGSYAQLYSFGASSMDGQWPTGGLAIGADGNFYGTTFFSRRRIGEEGGAGTIFRYVPGGGVSQVYDFNTTGTCREDGASPEGTMILGADGNLYGTTTTGGVYGKGTIFRLKQSGEVSVLYSFGSIANDGREPVGRLLQLADGNLVGTTLYGGTHEAADNYGGTAFMFSLDGLYTQLYSFGATPTDGQRVAGGLTIGAGGFLYGTTANGGVFTDWANNNTGTGTLFRLELDPAGAGPSYQSAPTTCPTEIIDPPQNSGKSGGGIPLSLISVLALAIGYRRWRTMPPAAVI